MKDILTVFRFTPAGRCTQKNLLGDHHYCAGADCGYLLRAAGHGSVFRREMRRSRDQAPGTSWASRPEKTETCYLIDEQKLLGAAEALAAALPQADVIVGEESRLDSCQAEAETDGSVYIVQIQPSETGTLPKVQFYVHDIMSGTSTGTVTAALKAAYVSQRCSPRAFQRI